MTAPIDATVAAHAAALTMRRAEALERELYAVRLLLAEVQQLRPGLLLDRLDGWHAGAADHYAERVRDIRLALAGTEHVMHDAEHALAAGVDALRRRGATS